MARTPNPNPEAKERIIETAEDLFYRQGFAATGIEQIATEAGITKSLIYYYFKSKKDILYAIFERFETESLQFKRDFMPRIIDGGGGIQQSAIIDVMMKQSFPFIERWKKTMKIAFVEEIDDFTEGPIFKYFNSNLAASKALFADRNHRFPAEKNFPTFVFFMVLFPILGYALLGDEWCRHSDLDDEEVKAVIADSTAMLFDAYLGRE